MDYQIFFLTGLPKGGTTWTLNMLMSCDDICCMGEGTFFSSALKDLPSLYDSIKTGINTWHNFIAHRKDNWLDLDRHITTINKTNYVPQGILDHSLTRQTDTILRNYVIDLFNRQRNNNIKAIGDKTPLLYIREFKRILRIFPEAKIVFLIRNLEDFIVSMIFHFWRSHNQHRADRNICLFETEDLIAVNNYITNKNEAPIRDKTLKKLATIWKDINLFAYRESLSNKNILIINYEDLKADTARHLKRILKFLGIDCNDKILHDIIDKNSIEYINKHNISTLKDHINTYSLDLKTVLDSNLYTLLNNFQSSVDKTKDRME